MFGTFGMPAERLMMKGAAVRCGSSIGAAVPRRRLPVRCCCPNPPASWPRSHTPGPGRCAPCSLSAGIRALVPTVTNCSGPWPASSSRRHRPVRQRDPPPMRYVLPATTMYGARRLPAAFQLLQPPRPAGDRAVVAPPGKPARMGHHRTNSAAGSLTATPACARCRSLESMGLFGLRLNAAVGGRRCDPARRGRRPVRPQTMVG